MFLILRRCFRQMPSVFVRNFCIVSPDSFFLLWFLPFLPPRVEVYDKILSFANRVGLTVTSNTCNSEKVVGFRSLETGHFREVMNIQSDSDVKEFCRRYAVEEGKIRRTW